MVISWECDGEGHIRWSCECFGKMGNVWLEEVHQVRNYLCSQQYRSVRIKLGRHSHRAQIDKGTEV